MSLPVYFVGMSAREGRFATCGWCANSDGMLQEPSHPDKADALVFDDRNGLPKESHSLAEALLSAAKKLDTDLIVLDFERPPSPAACALVAQLSSRCRVAAPEIFCKGSRAEPILSYHPIRETFAEFLRRIPPSSWLELRPVEEEVCYATECALPAQKTSDFFSELLQCHYRPGHSPEGLTLQLFDTPESFRCRVAALASRFCAAIGLQNELAAFGFSQDSL